jgi:hypothetical protein
MAAGDSVALMNDAKITMAQQLASLGTNLVQIGSAAFLSSLLCILLELDDLFLPPMIRKICKKNVGVRSVM